ncbi:hypothetical protein [Olsenella intestinalis]|uniref:hypothetical protein n=1 Tax=Olsenella intestinalis TaxID=2930083 RepID=UPI00200C1736|nr:hypothetical protein [Olsenella intestinalis]
MKQLACEMCGSTDLVKNGGVFVCQSCGCKYSVEEAKRMMVEGTVEVTGTVHVDNSEFVKRYLANARRAKEKEDWEEVEKYYNMVEQNDPDNIEAIFYSAYGKAKLSLLDEDIYKRQAAFKVLSNCISVIDDHYRPERLSENIEAIESMSADLGDMLVSRFVYSTESRVRTPDSIFKVGTIEATHALFRDLVKQFSDSIDNIKKIDDRPYLHEAMIGLYNVGKQCSYISSANMRQLIQLEERQLRALRRKTARKYWAKHPEERASLESQRSAFEKQLNELKEEERGLPGVAEKTECEERIRFLKNEISNLGIFEVKEKKARQDEIKSLEKRVEQIDGSQSGLLINIKARRGELLRSIEKIDKRLNGA